MLEALFNSLFGIGLDGSAALLSLLAVLAFAAVGWLVSLVRKDVSHVDSMWSLMFVVSLGTYAWFSEVSVWRLNLLLVLVGLWAVRLSAYITWRNFGNGEDHRYQAIRRRNEPGFAFKSLYLVFLLQGCLAWVVSFPILAAVNGEAPPGPLSYLLLNLGLLLWITGMIFEVVADAQLARFRSQTTHRGRVLNTGLWRYSRHPNYFGECVLWWGFFCLAWSAGAGWTVFAPVIMTILLLRVSGVALLEKDISQRRPEYEAYIRSTPAFIPWPWKSGKRGLMLGRKVA